jgi:hypothetical protein
VGQQGGKEENELDLVGDDDLAKICVRAGI